MSVYDEPVRVAGERGRLPKKTVAMKFAHQYLKQAILPVPSYPVDVSGGIKNWGMLGNDTKGDCGEAGIRHDEMSTAAGAGQPIPVFTVAEALKEYFAATGGQDTGLVLADFLLWLYKRGRIKGFAPVDHTNRAVVDGLLQAGHGIYSGVFLTDDANDRFNQGLPWTIANGEASDSSEGHCILLVGSSGSSPTDADTWVTWGALQQSTRAWSNACLDEAWLVLTTEEQMAQFVPQLVADIEALGGQQNVSTASAPTPPASRVQRLLRWLRGF